MADTKNLINSINSDLNILKHEWNDTVTPLKAKVKSSIFSNLVIFSPENENDVSVFKNLCIGLMTQQYFTENDKKIISDNLERVVDISMIKRFDGLKFREVESKILKSFEKSFRKLIPKLKIQMIHFDFDKNDNKQICIHTFVRDYKISLDGYSSAEQILKDVGKLVNDFAESNNL